MGWFDTPLRVLSGLVLLLLLALWLVLWLRRRRDRCLDLLREFPVEAELRDGSRLGGRLRVFGTGLLLRPAGPPVEVAGSGMRAGAGAGRGAPRATILYREEWGRLRSLACIPGELDDADRRSRNARLRGVFGKGGFGREARLRRVRSLLVALDAVMPHRTGRRVGDPPRDALRVPTASQPAPPPVAHFDQLLETLRGTAVAVERSEPETKQALQGILVEYSADFLLLGGVKTSGEEVISVPMSGRKTVPGLAEVHREGARITLKSLARETIQILRVESYTYLVPIGRAVEPGRTVLLELKNAQIPLLSLVLRVSRAVDLLLPRSSARIRESEVGAGRGWRELLVEESSARRTPLAPGQSMRGALGSGVVGALPPAGRQLHAGTLPRPPARRAASPPVLPPATRREGSRPGG